MMKMEDRVCSFDQAKKLFELIGNKGPFFSWEYGSHKKRWYVAIHDEEWAYQTNRKWYPAYTVAELGLMLPEYVEIYNGDEDIFVAHGDFATLVIGEGYWQSHGEEFNTEAQARASALIWLLENDYIKPENIKL
jgi:hypothetical protein